jgi:HSP20 family protein
VHVSIICLFHFFFHKTNKMSKQGENNVALDDGAAPVAPSSTMPTMMQEDEDEVHAFDDGDGASPSSSRPAMPSSMMHSSCAGGKRLKLARWLTHQHRVLRRRGIMDSASSDETIMTPLELLESGSMHILRRQVRLGRRLAHLQQMSNNPVVNVGHPRLKPVAKRMARHQMLRRRCGHEQQIGSMHILRRQARLGRRLARLQKRTNPAVNVVKTDEQIQITMDVPGVKMEDLKVTMNDENRVLTMSGERKSSGASDDTPTSKFSKRVVLGESVDTTKIVARLENGVLTVSAPKSLKTNEESVRQIPIRGISATPEGGESEDLEMNQLEDEFDAIIVEKT